jgi:hypothetical protein
MNAESTLSQLRDQERAFHQAEGGDVSYRALHDESHNNVWRKMVVQWCYNVVDHIHADREIVYVAINILDRFLASYASAPSPKARDYLSDRKDYEAAVMTSLLITLKLQGISDLGIQDLIKMSSRSIASKDIILAGKAIVESLKWNKQIPTAARFAHALVDLLPADVRRETREALYDQCIFFIELSVQDKRASGELPSLLAWMALENAMCAEGLTKDTIASFRANVVRITGLEYKRTLRQLLQNMYEMSAVDISSKHNQQRDDGNDHSSNQHTRSSQGVHVIPPDNEVDGRITPSSEITMLSKLTHASNVVSVEDMSNMSCFKMSNPSLLGKKRCSDDQPTLPRTKRFRVI